MLFIRTHSVKHMLVRRVYDVCVCGVRYDALLQCHIYFKHKIYMFWAHQQRVFWLSNLWLAQMEYAFRSDPRSVSGEFFFVDYCYYDDLILMIFLAHEPRTALSGELCADN